MMMILNLKKDGVDSCQMMMIFFGGGSDDDDDDDHENDSYYDDFHFNILQEQTGLFFVTIFLLSFVFTKVNTLKTMHSPPVPFYIHCNECRTE